MEKIVSLKIIARLTNTFSNLIANEPFDVQ